MLINDDKEGRKKRKYYQKVMRSGNKYSKRMLRSLLVGVGGILSVIAVALVTVGILSSKAKAMDSLKLVTNSGLVLSGSEFKMMDGAQVYVQNYTNDSGVDIYYKFYDNKLGDVSGIDLSSNGERYTEGSCITLNRSSQKGGVRYLYIQQKSQAESVISSFQISFYDKVGEIYSTPATSDSDMTEVKVGDTITFAGVGTMYYTDDGTEPSFVRDSKGTICINGENFRLENEKMRPFEAGNAITVTEDWLKDEIKTIRVRAYKDGYDIGDVEIFRFKITQDQAQAPTIKPVTTAESPITVDAKTTATLSTATDGGTILYSMNGKVPTYSIKQAENGYQVVTDADSYIYDEPILIDGEPDAEIVITALTIKINETTGVAVMKDSNPVQFIYKITSRAIAAAPEASPEAGTELGLNSKVYLNTATAGGTILYTVDGSAPAYEVVSKEKGYELVAQGTTKVYGKETSYVEVKEPEARQGQTFLIQAKTVKVDLNTGKKSLEDSSVAQFSYRITDAEMVAAPTATPATTEKSPTVVNEGSKIVLNSTTAGAKIYYTLDGTSPYINEDGSLSKSTNLYNGKDAIVVPAGTGFFTITAIAVKDGMNDSTVVQFVYQYPGTVAPPYVSPAEGTVSINTEVILASIDKEAQIYYTLDGTEPTGATARFYSEPILLTQDTIIKAICVVDGISSAVKTFTFYVAQELLPPSPSIESGAVLTSGTTLKLTAQKGAQIYYTTDGSSPKQDGAMAGDTVTITGKAGETITLITYAKGTDYSDSQTATYVYTISNYENGIKINPEVGTKVKDGDVITLETDVTNGTIYYSVDGTSPTAKSAYGTVVTVGGSATEDKYTLKATVVSAGSDFTASIATFIYEYLEKLVAPKASIPNGAVLLGEQDIVLTTEEGDIYYTIDESVPTNKSDLYTEPIHIAENTTIQAVSISEEGAASDVAVFGYTFAEQVKTPEFSINGGEVESGTTLTITSATSDAVIYYTTDGQMPDLNNPKNLFIYSGAIVLNKPVNIKAMAVKDRMTASKVNSAIFTVREPEVIITDEEAEEEVMGQTGDRLMSRRAYMNNSSGPAYSDFVLKSVATGVVVSAEEGAIPAETSVEVMETVVDTALNNAVMSSMGEDYGAVASYDVSLTIGTETLQPTGDVELGLPIPQQYRNSAISIAYVDEDGNVEVCETRRDGDMAYAHVTHFSRYCIVAPVNLSEEESENIMGKVIPVTGAFLLVAGYLLIRLGRKKNKENNSILDD